MADISKEELHKEITAILKDVNLTIMSAKKVCQQIEEKLNVVLTERKKEVDDLVMECLQEKQDGKGKGGGKKKNSKEKEEEEKPKPKRGGGAAKKPPAKKSKKACSDISDEASDEDISDEEYSPSNKGKGTPANKSKVGAMKKKGTDSDSDEDWAKSRKSNSGGGGKRAGGGGVGGGGGAKKGGNRYTRFYTLSPELAALMRQEAMPRYEVVRKIWAIITEINLYDPKNKQFAICDYELMKVFGVKRFRTFGMMKCLKNHFID